MGTSFGFTQPGIYRGGCLSIGNFDGVHRGHQHILNELSRHALRMGVPAVVVTFDPHPASILAPDRLPPALTTLKRRVELVSQMGVDTVLVVPTTKELLNLTAAEFFDQVLLSELQFRGIVEGSNFCFGKGRQGTVDSLQEMCHREGLECHVVPPVFEGDETVSSSLIRGLLKAGDVVGAKAMLGRPHRATGVVVEGAKRGRTIGFSTANLEQVETMLPTHGVYSGSCTIDGKTYKAAVNLGPNPTFDEQASKLEVHLLDFAGDLYGRTMDVDFVERLRDVIKFESATQLLEQLRLDVERVRRSFG